MSLALSINSIDRTDHVEWHSLQKTEGLTKEPDSLFFMVKKTPTKTIPALGQEVVLEENGDVIFRGTITERTEYVQGGLLLGYSYTCKDPTHDLDRRLVAKSYTNMTAGAIISDIISTFTTGFTDTNVDTGPTISSLRFNYIEPSKCIQKIADLCGYDWYVDYDYDIHFFAENAISAPFSISDTTGNLEWQSLEFDRNIIELKNSVIVRGGEYKSEIEEADAVDKYIADGTQRVFTNIYRYSDIQVEVEGVAQTVGIDNINDAADFDVLYNFQEKAIKFRDNNKPALDDEVVVFGDAHIPLISTVRDNSSIATYGLYEHVEIDKSITSIDEAKAFAKSILRKWSEGAWDGKFNTTETTLRTGQNITIDSDEFGVSKTFKINRIVGKANGNESMKYTVYFVSSGDVNFTDIMVKLLSRDKQNIEVNDYEVLQRFELFEEVPTIADTLGTPTFTTGPYKWGPSSNTLRWSFGTWG